MAKHIIAKTAKQNVEIDDFSFNIENINKKISTASKKRLRSIEVELTNGTIFSKIENYLIREGFSCQINKKDMKISIFW